MDGDVSQQHMGDRTVTLRKSGKHETGRAGQIDFGASVDRPGGDQIFDEQVVLKPFEDVWIQLKTGSDSVNIKLDSGYASIDGHPLNQFQNSVSTGEKSFFVFSWTGCKLRFSSKECSILWQKSSALFTILPNALRFKRVAVLDNNVSVGITTANNVYSLNRVANSTVTFINLDIDQSHGVISIYPMNCGTIPPHNPVDFFPSIKQSLWVGDFKRLVQTVEKDISQLAGHLVVYMNYNTTPVWVVTAVCKAFGFDCCFTSDDYSFCSTEVLSDCKSIMNIPTLVRGPVTKTELADTMNRHVFNHPIHAVMNYPSSRLTETENNKPGCDVFESFSDNMLPTTSENNVLGTYKPMDGMSKTGVYAAVRHNISDTLGFWGFVYMDMNNNCHSILPVSLLRKTLILIYVGFAII